MSWVSDYIAREATRAVAEGISSGRYDHEITGAIVRAIRSAPDSGLNRLGFVSKMAVHLMDRCDRPKISFSCAKAGASNALRDFLAGEKIAFGEPGYDWSGAGARLLAQELVIEHWEPTP